MKRTLCVAAALLLALASVGATAQVVDSTMISTPVVGWLPINQANNATNANFATSAGDAALLGGKPEAALSVSAAVNAQNSALLGGKPEAALDVATAVSSTTAAMATMATTATSASTASYATSSGTSNFANSSNYSNSAGYANTAGSAPQQFGGTSDSNGFAVAYQRVGVGPPGNPYALSVVTNWGTIALAPCETREIGYAFPYGSPGTAITFGSNGGTQPVIVGQTSYSYFVQDQACTGYSGSWTALGAY